MRLLVRQPVTGFHTQPVRCAQRNPGRFAPGSFRPDFGGGLFRPWQVGCFGPGSFRPDSIFYERQARRDKLDESWMAIVLQGKLK